MIYEKADEKNIDLRKNVKEKIIEENKSSIFLMKNIKLNLNLKPQPLTLNPCKRKEKTKYDYYNSSDEVCNFIIFIKTNICVGFLETTD